MFSFCCVLFNQIGELFQRKALYRYLLLLLFGNDIGKKHI